MQPVVGLRCLPMLPAGPAGGGWAGGALLPPEDQLLPPESPGEQRPAPLLSPLPPPVPHVTQLGAEHGKRGFG